MSIKGIPVRPEGNDSDTAPENTPPSSNTTKHQDFKTAVNGMFYKQPDS